MFNRVCRVGWNSVIQLTTYCTVAATCDCNISAKTHQHFYFHFSRNDSGQFWPFHGLFCCTVCCIFLRFWKAFQLYAGPLSWMQWHHFQKKPKLKMNKWVVHAVDIRHFVYNFELNVVRLIILIWLFIDFFLISKFVEEDGVNCSKDRNFHRTNT